jgi:hypothetical protein
MEDYLQEFIEELKSSLKYKVQVTFKLERIREEGVLYSISIRPFAFETSKTFTTFDGYLATPERKAVVRKMASTFKRVAKKYKFLELDPAGFLTKAKSKKHKGESYYLLSSVYLHYVFIRNHS